METSATTTTDLTLVPRPVILGANIYPCYIQGTEPLVRDLDLAEWLGYEDRHKIRGLIHRHAASLGGVSATMAETASLLGGRPGKTYYLNERQVLRLCAKSETPRANQVLDAMIDVFMEARRGSREEGGISLRMYTEAMNIATVANGELKKSLDTLEDSVRCNARLREENERLKNQNKLLIANAARKPPARNLAAAMEQLRQVLGGGNMVEARTIEEQARALGISERTLRRAKKRLGVISRRTAYQGVYFWLLPNGLKH